MIRALPEFLSDRQWVWPRAMPFDALGQPDWAVIKLSLSWTAKHAPATVVLRVQSWHAQSAFLHSGDG